MPKRKHTSETSAQVVYTDITVGIAATKARSKCRGPWRVRCPLCGGAYPEGRKESHLEKCIGMKR